jgi:hypothetical protein
VSVCLGLLDVTLQEYAMFVSTPLHLVGSGQ